jgi:hypothetical protein
MDLSEFFSLWLGLSAAATFYATRLHRRGIVWLFVSLTLSPVIAFAVLFGLGPKDDAHVPCPYCGEVIKLEAIRCPFCRTDLPTDRETRGATGHSSTASVAEGPTIKRAVK